MQLKKLTKKVLPVVLAGTMVFGSVITGSADTATESADAALDFAAAGYEWEAVDSDEDGTADYYQMKNVYYCTNVVTETLQYMNIYAPAEYFNANGTINYSAEVNGYNAYCAPIVLQNNCSGWKSSTPGDVDTTYLDAGMIYVNCGARSRDDVNTDGTNDGKAPAPVVDLKSAVRDLRLNDYYIPGTTDYIISVGTSGGGQMSSILGASGNMDEYYSYLYESGAAGIELVDGEYVSTIDDDIWGTMCYCPIADIDNSDLAYAWMRYGANDTGAVPMFGDPITFSDFQLKLQDDLAEAYVDYINSWGIRNEDGDALSLKNVRSGSYYDQILENISDSLNAFVKNQKFPMSVSKGFGPSATTVTYNTLQDFFAATLSGDTSSWLVQNEDGTYEVTDLAGFVNGTGLERNKDIPGFDTFDEGAENDAFGKADETAVHYSVNVAKVLKANYSAYKALEGFSAVEADVDAYIEDTTREDIQNQTYLMNATQIMWNVANGKEDADVSPYYRTRNGTADEHTSFTTAYNLAMAANAAGSEVDYSLVWNMGHGSNEGTTTGTFIGWIEDICPAYDVDAWSILDATVSAYTYTVDGKEIEVACLTDSYLKNTGDLSTSDYANALVNVYVPEDADEDSPILYMVDNSGWRSNTYQAAGTLLEEGVDYVSTDDGNMAAMALKNGYIVVDAGLRTRGGADADGNYNHSAVTVADAKAVVRYLKYNEVGNSDMIFITGTSGGGALSAAVGASGNSADFTAELEAIGACMETTDDVYGVIAYCPITDLGHSDMSYDFTYAGTRQDLIDSGYTTPAEFAGEFPHPGQYALNEISMELSPILAAEYVDYVESLGIEGTDLAFDADTLTSSGELWDTMKAIVIAALQKELDEAGPEAFEAALEERVVDEASYIEGTPNDGWQTDWVIYTDESKETIADIDADGYLYYVALGQGLKPAPAFTNDGIGYVGVFYNENNLFGPDTDAHGYISECVFELSDLKEMYGTWDAYWEANGELITMQAKMVDSIAYLADEDGESDAAPYWYVRHGVNDRDTGFANQTLLYAALADNDTIKTLDFAFVFGLGHTGGYAVDEVEVFMAKAVGADADDTYKTLYEYSPLEVEEDDSPKTGEAFPIAMVVVVVAAVAVCFTTRRKMA